jgi:hypothetical protein
MVVWTGLNGIGSGGECSRVWLGDLLDWLTELSDIGVTRSK